MKTAVADEDGTRSWKMPSIPLDVRLVGDRSGLARWRRVGDTRYWVYGSYRLTERDLIAGYGPIYEIVEMSRGGNDAA